MRFTKIIILLCVINVCFGSDVLESKIKQVCHKQGDVRNIKGNIAERFMSAYFTQILGFSEIKAKGQNSSDKGIDGIFVKYANNAISEIFIVESKFAKSPKISKNSKQMSNAWIKNHLAKLSKHNPQISVYGEILGFVNADNFRKILWNPYENNDKLSLKICKIKDNGSYTNCEKIAITSHIQALYDNSFGCE